MTSYCSAHEREALEETGISKTTTQCPKSRHRHTCSRDMIASNVRVVGQLRSVRTQTQKLSKGSRSLNVAVMMSAFVASCLWRCYISAYDSPGMCSRTPAEPAGEYTRVADARGRRCRPCVYAHARQYSLTWNRYRGGRVVTILRTASRHLQQPQSNSGSETATSVHHTASGNNADDTGVIHVVNNTAVERQAILTDHCTSHNMHQRRSQTPVPSKRGVSTRKRAIRVGFSRVMH